MTERRTIPLRRIFLVPAVLAVLSAAGLASALLGNGAWDVVSWLAMAIPLIVIGQHLFRAGRRM